MGKVLGGIVLAMGIGSPAVAEPVVIAALGDSLTQGYGLPQEQGFVPQLENWLNANGSEVQMINAGVSGDTTAGGLARIDWTLTPEVDALIVTLGGNDFLRGIDPAVSRTNLEGILQKAQAQNLPVLMIGMQAPGNFGPAYKRAFDTMYPELSQQYGTLLVESFLGALGETPAEVTPSLQPDGIHPNAQGVAKIVASVGPSVVQLVDLVTAGKE
ncbi:arylesterase [Actibacterium pelagium]|uniref:Arylesterase n=1 Tax=Actibacterium pelagium TaxID=2029103 RepID=A0A917ANE0_9RHOB|nr:arylesterase [Actibacterium pelagium]GGE62128.1 arylesterase [Actibacterium pelagium]